MNIRLRELSEHVAASRERAPRVAGGLTAAQLNWRPAPERWGVGHCLEHMITSHEAMAPQMKEKIAAARASQPGGHHEPWKSSFMGRFLIRSINPATGARKVRTQKVFYPREPARVDALDIFLRTLDDLERMILQCDGLDVGKVRIVSPALRLIRYNLGDALAILAFHSVRHLNQAEGVKAEPGFPRA